MTFLLGNWKYIAMGALGILAGWFYLEWSNAELEADRYQIQLSVSNNSIDTLMGSIADLREQALQRAALLESARSQARQDAERFARDREALEATNRRLTALVRPRDGLCPADDTVLEILDEL